MKKCSEAELKNSVVLEKVTCLDYFVNKLTLYFEYVVDSKCLVYASKVVYLYIPNKIISNRYLFYF